MHAGLLETKADGIKLQLSNQLKVFMKLEHFSDFECNQDGMMFVYQTAEKKSTTVKDLVYLGEHRNRHTVSFYFIEMKSSFL